MFTQSVSGVNDKLSVKSLEIGRKTWARIHRGRLAKA